MVYRGHFGTDLIGFRGTDGGVDGEGFLPMAAGLSRVSGGMPGAGEASVGAGLLPWRASVGGKPQSDGVVGACRTGVTRPAEKLTEAVVRLGLLKRNTGLVEGG